MSEYGVLSKWFNIEQEIKQRFLISLWLFNVFMDKYIRNAWGNIRSGLAEDRNVSVAVHAGNVVLLAKNLNHLQGSSSCLHDVTKK